MPRPFRLLLPFAALALSGCLLGPDYERPDAAADLPDAFRTGGAAAADGAEAAAPADEAAWWDAWGDPLLARLLEEGCATNLTVREAAARLRQSRAELDAARAALSPTLGVSGSGSKSKTYDPDDSAEAYRAGADAGWEIDLFGKNRRSAEAASVSFLRASRSISSLTRRRSN